jgi:plastocyanin
MTKKAWMYIVGGVVVIVLIILIAMLWGKKAATGPEGGVATGSVSGVVPEESKTRLEVPANTKVPDANSEVGADVAKPTAVANAAPGVSSKFRAFSISINNNDFAPGTVIISVGDIAHIDFTAVDRSYDITQPDYGFKLNIAKGETKLLEGQYSTAGKYIFYCSECGGPDKGPVGYIVVVPK